MKGLSYEHYIRLTSGALVGEERKKAYAQCRELYADDPLALEEIDIIDGESPFGLHMEKLKDAFRSGDSLAEAVEMESLAEHYPLTTKT
jgi:hypothetical protein